MTKEDLDKMLVLLRKIDKRLMEIQIGIIKDKIKTRIKMNSRVPNGYITNFLMLILQIYIAFWGYQYIKSTTTTIPPIAIIGMIGISFVIINSLFKFISDSYSIFKMWKKIKRTALSFTYLMPPLLSSTNEPDPNIISKEYLDAIADDLIKRMIEIADGGKSVDEFIDELKRESSPHGNVRTVEQNP